MYSREIRSSAVALVESGKAITTAAKAVGVSRRILHLWYYTAHPAKKAPPQPCTHRRGQPHPETTMEAAWQMKANGDKYEYICAILNLPMNTMCDWFTFRTRIETNKKIAKKYGFEVAE